MSEAYKEFKNLEEIIALSVEELYVGDRNIHATLGFEELKELQNLLNKERSLEIHTAMLINQNKELEKERDGIYKDYQDLGKEKLISDTMFELFYKDFHDRNCTNYPCNYEEELKHFEEYYRNKAKVKLFENSNSEEGYYIPRTD